jgi:hypothetical protein
MQCVDDTDAFADRDADRYRNANWHAVGHTNGVTDAFFNSELSPRRPCLSFKHKNILRCRDAPRS